MKRFNNIIINPKGKKLIIPPKDQVFILDYIKDSSRNYSLPIFIGSGARVQYVLILESRARSKFIVNREIHLAPQAELNSYQLYLGQADYKINISNNLASGAILNNQVLFWLKGQQTLQVQNNYIFKGSGALGKFKVNGLVDNQAKAQYYSDLVIKPQAQLTNTQIDMNLYLLNSRASASLSPSLKIAANDVKAGHSVSTFHLSTEDLFYLQTRGLDSAQVKSLIINSLLQQFVANISDQHTKQLILDLVNRRIN